MSSDASTRGSRTQNETRIVRNLTKRSITLGDMKFPFEIRPGQSVDLLKYVSLNNIAKSKDLKIAVQLGLIEYKDRNNKTVKKSKICKAIIPAVLRDIEEAVASVIHDTTEGIEIVRDTLTVSGDTFLNVGDHDDIFADATSGAFDLILPTAVGVAGYSFTIKRINTNDNNVTVKAAAGEKIDDENCVILNIPYMSLTFRSDGAKWWIT